jgi:predicted aspartyl protease
MKLKGVTEGRESLILVDSGSSHTFLSKQFANGLSGLQQLVHSVQVQLANGETL